MKKTKKRHPKTHGKSKKRALPPGTKRARPSAATTRDKLATLFDDGPSETASEIIDMMSMMNPARFKEFVRMLGEIQALDEPRDAFEEDGPSFMEFVELCRSELPGARPVVEDTAPLTSLMLNQLQIRSESGDPRLLRAIAKVHARLEEVADDEDFPAGGLMTLAKVLADAGWQVPGALKVAVVRALEKSSGALDKPALVADILPRLGEPADYDEFDLCERLATTLEAFPAELAAELVGPLAEAARGVLDRAMVGFALHREPAVAAAALEACRKIESRPVDGLVVERLVRIRSWTPPDRHPWIDAAIDALGPKAEPRGKPRSGRVERLGITTCDGFGTHFILGSTREDSAFWTVGAVARPSGFQGFEFFEDLTAADASDSLENLISNTKMTETDIPGITRVLSLTLADGLARGVSPKFRLVDFVERLGIGALTPRAAAAAEIAEDLLAGLPDEATGAAALARAYDAMDEADWSSAWLESGPQVLELLEPTTTAEEGLELLLKSRMPERKPFWAWICARTALAFRGQADRPPTSDCIHLALIARDLCSDKAVEHLPFLRRIAARTANIHAGDG